MGSCYKGKGGMWIHFQNQINKILKRAQLILGAEGWCVAAKILGSTRWGRCINFQNQIKILKGPNSFWGLRAVKWEKS